MTSSKKARLLRTLVAGTEGGALGARNKVGGEEAGREEEGGDEERIQGGEEGRRDRLAPAAAEGGGACEAQSACSGGRSGILLHRLLGEGGGITVGPSGSVEAADFLADFQALQWKKVAMLIISRHSTSRQSTRMNCTCKTNSVPEKCFNEQFQETSVPSGRWSSTEGTLRLQSSSEQRQTVPRPTSCRHSG